MLTEKERDLEIWADIEGYEGLYQISHLGRVKSLARVIYKTDGTIQTFKERILKTTLDTKGYVICNLSKEYKCKTFRVHRLVANMFIPNLNNKPQVNHINGIKADNRVSNLEWVTNSENQKHAVKLGLKEGFKGIEHNLVKLTEEQVLEIRESNLTQRKLAKKYNINQSTISMIKNRKIWTHI